VEAQAVHVGVMRFEVVAGKALEPLVGCAEDVHRAGSVSEPCPLSGAPRYAMAVRGYKQNCLWDDRMRTRCTKVTDQRATS
jgi:hypothetical protein